MARIGVAEVHRLTPGSLRPGGAVALHRSGVQIQDLLWRMRLQHLQTLANYLQEVSASSVLPALPQKVRHNISLLKGAMPAIIMAEVRSAQPCQSWKSTNGAVGRVRSGC